MPFFRFPCMIMISLICMGCGWGALPDRDLKEYLQESEILGIWKLTDESKDAFSREAMHHKKAMVTTGTVTIDFGAKNRSDFKGTCTIILRKDKTCVFDSVVYDGFDSVALIKEEGKWSLDHDTPGDSDIVKHNALRLELHPEGNKYNSRSIWFNFTKDKGKLMFWNYIGDPDSCVYAEYIKANKV